MLRDYDGKRLETSLINKQIAEIAVSEDQSQLIFLTYDDKVIPWKVEGDCCSWSYWADLTGMRAFDNDAVVTAIDSIPMPQTQTGKDELTQVYGYLVTTTRGKCTIAFRNESNGYYGGWAELVEGDSYKVPPLKQIYSQQNPRSEWSV